jgi:opacity protein-like surface antigen
VYRRLSLRLLCLLLTLALPASAQFTRDNAANKKIDEAINEHYLATDFDKAEGVLTGTVQACGDKCSPQVIARAWMYVGIVRGSGKNDQAGAKEAFQKAIATDPQVKLDTALATPETQKTFDGAGGAGGSAPTPEPPGEKPAPAAAGAEEEGPGGMKCTPDAMEIQTRRPVPVECVSDEEAASVELRYKPFGGDWKTVKMTKKGESFRGEIPCADTKTAGDLKVYARAKDAAGETIDNWGSKNKPINYTMGESVTGEPPAFAGEKAPDRCADSSECPPDFPGCGGGSGRGNVDWGGKCENSTECKAGLLCEGGVCETAPSCEKDDDCSTGKCTAGKCDVGDDVATSSGPYKKNWLGLHFGVDIAVIGGSNVCGSQGGYECYTAGSETEAYGGPPYPGTGIATGTAIATKRILLSYDRAFTPNLMAGIRLGYAFGGGPPAITGFKVDDMNQPVYDAKGNAVPNGRINFLPFHAEGRVSYWFGHGALGKKGIRPYVFGGGGLAQVDAKVKVTVYDCSQNMNPPAGCETGDPSVKRSTLPRKDIDAWKKLGQGFVAAGGGVVYAFKENIGVQANVNFMFMLGASGPVLEPSLGIVYGL